MPGSSPVSGWPIPLDSDPLGDAAGQIIRDLVDAIEAGWTAYTPTLTAVTTNPTLGTGSVAVGAYKRIGKTVFWRASILCGSAGVVAGSGTYQLSLPPIAAKSTERSQYTKGSGLIKDSSTVAAVATFYGASATIVNIWASTSTTLVSGAISGAQANRSYEAQGQYEAA